jgi:hypothetical protein
MKRSAVIAVFLPLLLSAFLAAQEPATVIRVYSLKHISAPEMVRYIQPLLSPAGDLRIQPAQNLLQVRDIPERQKLVEQMIASLDVAPAGYRIAIKFMEGSQAPPAGGVREEVAGIGAQLKGLMPYASYAILEQLVIEGVPGDQISYRLGKDYHVEFKLTRVLQHPQMIQLAGLRLFRVKGAGEGKERLIPVLRTTINLTVGRTHVLGASAMQEGSKALVMVFQAEVQ